VTTPADWSFDFDLHELQGVARPVPLAHEMGCVRSGRLQISVEPAPITTRFGRLNWSHDGELRARTPRPETLNHKWGPDRTTVTARTMPGDKVHLPRRIAGAVAPAALERYCLAVSARLFSSACVSLRPFPSGRDRVHRAASRSAFRRSVDYKGSHVIGTTWSSILRPSMMVAPTTPGTAPGNL